MLLFSTVMYLKEKLMSSTLPIFCTILCLFGDSRGYSCTLVLPPFSLFLLETWGGPQWRSFVRNVS